MMKRTLIVALGLLLVACSGEEPKENGGSTGGTTGAATGAHGHEGPHGGHVLEVGSHVAHLEVIHDDDSGKMTIYVLGEDLKTPLALAAAPQIKLSTNDGPKVVTTRPQDANGGKSSVFSATDAALKGHLHGRISVEIGGKTYNPELEHEDH